MRKEAINDLFTVRQETRGTGHRDHSKTNLPVTHQLVPSRQLLFWNFQEVCREGVECSYEQETNKYILPALKKTKVF